MGPNFLSARSQLRRITFVVALVLPVYAQNPQPMIRSSSGTVNVILASPNGLVAVTDSMLTFTDGSHGENAIKLYKLDDKRLYALWLVSIPEAGRLKGLGYLPFDFLNLWVTSF